MEFEDSVEQATRARLAQRSSDEAERDARFNRRVRLLELRERREDRDLKRLELTASSGKGIRFTSAQATVAAATLAVISAIAGGLIQGGMTRDVESGRNQSQIDIERLRAQATIDLEKQKQDSAEEIARNEFETTLILKAIEAPNRDTQIKNLKFFLNAGFISDKNDKIISMNESDFPSLPLPNQSKIYGAAEIAAKFRQSVGTVTFKYRADSGPELDSLGSIFMISDSGYAITANHVIRTVMGEPSEVGVRLSGSSNYAIASIVSRHSDLDFAVLKLPSGATPYSVVKLSPASPSLGDRVFVVGFNQEQLSISVATVTSLDGPNGTWLLDSGVVGSAGSGAPVFSDQGEVIGISRGMMLDPVGNSTGVSVRPVSQVLNLVSNLASGAP